MKKLLICVAMSCLLTTSYALKLTSDVNGPVNVSEPQLQVLVAQLVKYRLSLQ